MAESQQQQQSDESWWSSMITAAREKSVTALSVTKRDLAEFVSVLRNDTSVAVKNVSTNIKDLIHDMDDLDRPKSCLSPSTLTTSPPSLGIPYDRSQAQLFSLQSSSDTFLTDPLGVEAEYEAWTKQFDVQSHQSEISQLLVNCPHIRTLHGQLVPAKASYESFWHRYFFKLGLLQQEEQRRADLMARVQPPPQKDMQWEELEELGEGLTEERGDEATTEERGEEATTEERGEEGSTEERGEEATTEEKRNNKETEARNKDQQTQEDDLMEVASSIVEIKSDHLRSESSDSFVCISEDLPHSERSPNSPDGNGNGTGGEWEYLKMAEVGESGELSESGGSGEGDDVKTPVKKDGDQVGVVCGDGDSGETGEKGESKMTEGAGGESDWESWDD